MSEEYQVQTVVIGAGVVGLAVARELARRGREQRAREKADARRQLGLVAQRAEEQARLERLVTLQPLPYDGWHDQRQLIVPQVLWMAPLPHPLYGILSAPCLLPAPSSLSFLFCLLGRLRLLPLLLSLPRRPASFLVICMLSGAFTPTDIDVSHNDSCPASHLQMGNCMPGR